MGKSFFKRGGFGHRGDGGLVDGFQRDAPLQGDPPAGFELGGGLEGLSIEGAGFHFDLAEGGFDAAQSAFELAAFGGRSADAERGSFAQEQFGKPVLVRGGAENGEEDAGAILLHLNGGVKHVECTFGEGFFDDVTKDFGIDVIEVCFEDGDMVGFPIMSRGRCVGSSEKGAQDVRPGFVVSFAEAVTNFFGGELERAEPLDEFGQDGGAGGGNEFVGFIALGNRDAPFGENRDCGRRGNGETAVCAVDPTSAFGDGGGLNIRFAEQFEADRSSDDIDDRVDGADFMEMNLICGLAVNPAFSARDAMEDSDGFLFDPGRERAGLNQLADFRESAPMEVSLLGVLVVLMLVAGAVFIFMFVFMDMFMAVGMIGVMVVTMLVLVGVNVEFNPFDGGLVLPGGVDVKLAEMEFIQFVLESVEGNSEVKHGADEHVAADAAEDIEVKSFHYFPAASELICAAA